MYVPPCIMIISLNVSNDGLTYPLICRDTLLRELAYTMNASTHVYLETFEYLWILPSPRLCDRSILDLPASTKAGDQERASRWIGGTYSFIRLCRIYSEIPPNLLAAYAASSV